MKMALTDKYVAALTPGTKDRVDIGDTLTPGLYIRVTRDRKTWTYSFTMPGVEGRPRLGLGTYPATSLKVARERATEARGHVEAGTDPRTINAAPIEKPYTIADLCEDRLRLEVRPAGKEEFRSAEEIKRRYHKEIMPVIGDVAVRDFRKRDYNKVIDKINERGAFVVANRVHHDLRRLCKFAVRRDEMEFSPLSELEPPNKEQERDRYLKLPEIVQLWQDSPQALIRSPKAQVILKLLLTTGKRSDQVCAMKRTEIDFGKRLWTIPKERVKGTPDEAREELVPLSDLAISLLRPVLASHNNEYVFPKDDGDGPFVPGVLSKAVRLAIESGRLPMEPWTPHDLRRTVGTQLLNRDNGLGVTKDQKYLVLHHLADMKKNVSDRVYDWNDYLPEKREALDRWGAFLTQLVGVELGIREAA